MSRKTVKNETAIGNGLSNGAATISTSSPVLKSQASTGSRNPHFSGETDSPTTLTGHRDGVPISGGGPTSKKYGWTSASGSSIEVDDTPGAESVSVKHHTGAAVTIDPDGSIQITSSSRKGIGVSAPFGDAYMSASGDVVLKGASLSFQTSGDVNFDVGGIFNLKSGGYKITTKNVDETIDGYFSSSITNDYNQIVGGVRRETVAGDKREQITGENILDVKGNNTTRISGDNDYNLQGDNVSKIDGDNTESIGGDNTHKIDGDSSESVGGTLNQKVADNNVISVGADLIIGASGTSTVSADGDMEIASQTETKISGTTTIVTGTTVDITASGNANLQAGGTARVVGSTSTVGGPTVTMETGVLLAPTPTPYSGSDTPSHQPLASGPSVEGPDGADAANQARVMEANDIVDGMTSIRKNPEYPGNAILESADAGSVGVVSHDQTTGGTTAYKQYSSRNTGTLNPVSSENFTEIPDTSERRTDITAIDPSISVPSRNDPSAKISRYFTLGELINAKHSHRIPNSSYQAVVKNHIFAAYNVLDPIKAKFPDLIITSAYRPGSSNHVTGKAIDMVVQSRNMHTHAEIARFARDNLPVDQVFLERNTSGRTHVHLRVTDNPNSTPAILTCGDPYCNSKTQGISIGFLTGKGNR